MKTTLLLLSGILVLMFAPQTFAQYAGWQHEGSLFILTTPEGANLPASASEEGFPLLVRLSKEFFDFSQAQPNGQDVRFSTSARTPLPYQIEEWDAARGTASVWVRVPKIAGNARQELHVSWGKADAKSESSGAAVFGESNGYLSVWHMDDTVADIVGTLQSKDVGTTPVPGMIGKARHFAGKQGIFCGDKISNYPTGASPHSSEAWFRPEQANGNVLAWGNEHAQGKIVMQFRSPPHVSMDCYFSGGNVAGESKIPMSQWVHVVHTYQKGDSRIYVNGVLDGKSKGNAPPLNLQSPEKLWIGGWYNNYNFVGDMDEVRISKVVRSADWVRLEYENQKPMQSLVGPIVQKGNAFAVSQPRISLLEGKSATVTAQAGGAQKVYWILKKEGVESVVAVDQFSYTIDAGRVSGDTKLTLEFKAVYASETKTIEIPVTIQEDIPDPSFALNAPREWNGRDTIEVRTTITNLDAMKAKGAADVKTTWTITGGAVIKEIATDKLILKRSQFTGTIAVKAVMENGGAAVVATANIVVIEPTKDAWVRRIPDKDEKPVDNQFYARDDSGEGTLYYNGALEKAADSVFLKVYAGDQIFKTESQKLGADKAYAFAVRLKPGLIKYKVEFGTLSNGVETVAQTVTNLVCGDAYIIQGQSNALATDTREESPPYTSDWIRSYGSPAPNSKDAGANLWCNPVWKAHKGDKAELGYWGMELAKRLVDSHKVPICIINGAVGGTRIDQHQRNEADHSNLTTIYGRTLWRVQQARLTHGIRGILWHQGENDQGADGPDDGFGWETYQQYFINLSASWKQDYPNVQHYYVFQIWPNACSMGINTSGDMLREVQRNLPRLYSNMGIMSTVGIRPAGGCHYPLAGWAEFARLIQPLIERDNYGAPPGESITPPNLKSARYTSKARDEIALEFDQPIVWNDAARTVLYLDDAPAAISAGKSLGNTITLQLSASSAAKTITYVKGKEWSSAANNLLYGINGIAALTFCDVPIAPE